MFAAILLSGVAPILNWAGTAYYGFPSAVVFGDQLFVGISGRDPRFGGRLLRATLATSAPDVPMPIQYASPLIPSRSKGPAKLDLRDYRLLVFQAGERHKILPLADIQLLESNDLGRHLRQLRGLESVSGVLGHYSGVAKHLLFPPLEDRAPDVPIPFVAGLSRWDQYTALARYDIQIAGPKTVRLFHAYEGTLFVSLEWDYLNNWFQDDPPKFGNKRTTPEDRKLRTGKLPADFTGHFGAYSDTVENRDYLVATSGVVYLSTPKGKAELDVQTVWDDPKHRVVGVVKDVVANEIYGWGFAGEPGSRDRFYVRLDPKPVATPYRVSAPLKGNRTDAFLESYECVRAFRKAAGKK